jgi:hypothetical protein
MTRGAREVSLKRNRPAAPYMVFQFYYGARPVEAATRKFCSLRSLVVGSWLLVVGCWLLVVGGGVDLDTAPLVHAVTG